MESSLLHIPASLACDRRMRLQIEVFQSTLYLLLLQSSTTGTGLPRQKTARPEPPKAIKTTDTAEGTATRGSAKCVLASRKPRAALCMPAPTHIYMRLQSFEAWSRSWHHSQAGSMQVELPHKTRQRRPLQRRLLLGADMLCLLMSAIQHGQIPVSMETVRATPSEKPTTLLRT